jgi:myo-inositol-1(or 4)-monophosphatase
VTKLLFVSRGQVEAAVAAMAGAGRLLVEGQPGIRSRSKADGTVVTDLDLEIQRSLKDQLCGVFPECVFVGEEDADVAEAACAPKPRLVLDPIDGTTAFARGLNFFSISLGLIDSEGEPLVGIVFMPGLGKWYAAALEATGWVSYAVSVRGGVARLKPLEVRLPGPQPWRLKLSYVYVHSDAFRRLDLSAFEGNIRVLGPSATHLAMLLDRGPDPCAVILTGYRLWDVIGGLILARAAGFEIRDLRQPDDGFSFPAFVHDLVHFEKMPPLVVGTADIVGLLIRTTQCRESHT